MHNDGITFYHGIVNSDSGDRERERERPATSCGGSFESTSRASGRTEGILRVSEWMRERAVAWIGVGGRVGGVGGWLGKRGGVGHPEEKTALGESRDWRE